jgi:hypothetical protein
MFGATGDEEGDLVPQAGEFDATEAWSSSGWMGAGTCLADYSLVLGGMLPTVEIPFSEWCWLLEVIGVFVMIASWMSAARIVIGGM